MKAYNKDWSNDVIGIMLNCLSDGTILMNDALPEMILSWATLATEWSACGYPGLTKTLYWTPRLLANKLLFPIYVKPLNL